MNLTSNYKIELFNGDLKNAVNETLLKYNYPALPLKQKIEEKNIGDCKERESMIEFEDVFAKTVGASRCRLQLLYLNNIFHDEVDQKAHDKIKDDFENNLKIVEYYKNQLYSFLISKAESFGIEITDEEKYYLFTDYVDGEIAMQKITSELIRAYGGLDNFVTFIKEYNEYVINNYLSNDQIISLEGDTRN